MQPRTESRSFDNRRLSIFICLIKRVHEAKSDYDYCNTIRLRIMRFVRFAYPEMIKEWEGEIGQFSKKSAELKEQILPEVSATYSALKQKLAVNHLLSEECIKHACDALEAVLELAPEDNVVIGFIPPQEQVVLERLKLLMHAIMYCGHANDIKEYVEDFSTDRLSIRLFNEKTFVPSYFQYLNVNDDFQGNIAGAWNHLLSIEYWWSTNTRDLFRKKKLHYNDSKAVARSSELLKRNDHRLSVKKIKEASKKTIEVNQSSIFSLDQLEISLDLIVHVISGRAIDVIKQSDNDCTPEVIRLSIENDLELRIVIQWALGIVEVKRVHVFHDLDGNMRANFISSLIDNPGKIIKIDQLKVNGARSEKYLRDIGIYGPLDTLFVQCKRGYKASFIADKVSLNATSKKTIVKLMQYLDSLETIEWRNNIDQTSNCF